MALNEFQKTVSKLYGGGDYSNCKTLDECREAGDGLFTFIMIELDNKEDCDSLGEAISRMRGARDEVEMILTAFQDEEARLDT